MSAGTRRLGLGLGRYVALPLLLALWPLAWPLATAGAALTRIPAPHAVLRLEQYRRIKREGADLPTGTTPGTRRGAPARRAVWRQDAAILMYHRVADDAPPVMAVSPRHFRQQMAYLRRYYHIVPLSDLAARLRAGEPLPPRAVAVTFDDGYRDNLIRAAPIMAAHGISAALFMATAPQEHGLPLWWDALALAGIDLAATRAQLRRLTHQELCAFVARALDRLSHEDVARAIERLYLSWDDLRAWLGLGMEVGGHTVTHPILARLSPEHALAEIRASKATLEREAGREISLFAYPNGKAGDFSAATARLLAETGFVAACTTIEGLNGLATDPLTLRRICARDEPLPLFALRLAGLLPRAQAMLRGSRR